MTVLSPDDMRRRVQGRFDSQPFMATLGARLAQIEPGAVEIEMPVAPHIAQQHGFVHGGAVASLGDAACGFAAMTLLPVGAGILTAEFKINLIAPAAGEKLVAKGKVVKAGRTLTLSMAEIFAISGGAPKLCAVVMATLMTIIGREGVAD